MKSIRDDKLNYIIGAVAGLNSNLLTNPLL